MLIKDGKIHLFVIVDADHNLIDKSGINDLHHKLIADTMKMLYGHISVVRGDFPRLKLLPRTQYAINLELGCPKDNPTPLSIIRNVEPNSDVVYFGQNKLFIECASQFATDIHYIVDESFIGNTNEKYSVDYRDWKISSVENGEGTSLLHITRKCLRPT